MGNVNLTKRAAEEVLDLIKKGQEGDEPEFPEGDLVLRVMVKGGGCSGFTYGMGFQTKDEVQETDTLEEIEGVSVVVDDKSKLYLDGVTIDFVDGLMGRGFTFSNPSSSGSCGCGSSFSI